MDLLLVKSRKNVYDYKVFILFSNDTPFTKQELYILNVLSVAHTFVFICTCIEATKLIIAAKL